MTHPRRSPHAGPDRRGRSWAATFLATIAAGALCAGCGSSNKTTTGGSSGSSSAPAAHGFLAAREPFTLTVDGDSFQVALITSRVTGSSPDGDAAAPGHAWLEAELKVTSLQKRGLADIGWLDNSIHMYANGNATGQSCSGASVFANLCLLNVSDVDDNGGKPGDTFLDASLRPRQSQLLWAFTSDIEKSTKPGDVAVTLAPLIYGLTFRAPIVKSSDAPSGQVVLNTGGPRLKPGAPIG
jgi:hypothetical protein